jgi:glutaminyl-peptide cyclotransferase
MRIFAILIAGLGASLLAQSTGRRGVRAPIEYTYEVVRAYPHDPNAFTQGFEYRDGFLYEGTGLNGRSSLRRVRLETGQVAQRTDLQHEFFGEGITVHGDEVFQLTWQSQIGFVYRLSDFQLLRKFSYQGEGWGLASSGTEVFMSDGTNVIRVLDPRTLAERRRIPVHDGNTAVSYLNELEFVDGEIFANVWQSERIARISPQTGAVVGWIDLSGLLGPMYRSGSVDVLNGIAYDKTDRRLFVTGKLWPRVFEIKLIPKRREAVRRSDSLGQGRGPSRD